MMGAKQNRFTDDSGAENILRNEYKSVQPLNANDNNAYGSYALAA